VGEEKKITALIAIDFALKFPYAEMTQEGPLKTWVKVKDESVDVVIYSCNKPGRFMNFINDKIESWRWLGGTFRAYFVSYLLMILLFPLRAIVPNYRVMAPLNNALVIKINFIEALFAQRWKKLSILKYFLNETEHNFIFLVTPSCYIKQRLFVEKLKTLSNTSPLYAGSLQFAHDGPFIAGGALILDRAAARTLLEGKLSIPTHTMDDVSFGVLAQKRLLEPISLEMPSFDNIDAVDLRTISSHFYIRLKSGTSKKRLDAKAMNTLHSKFVDSNLL
jgi:hypothetical protein